MEESIRALRSVMPQCSQNVELVEARIATAMQQLESAATLEELQHTAAQVTESIAISILAWNQATEAATTADHAKQQVAKLVATAVMTGAISQLELRDMMKTLNDVGGR